MKYILQKNSSFFLTKLPNLPKFNHENVGHGWSS
jgi:hypothetical protein